MLIRVSERSSEPLYLQIAAQVRGQLAAGTLRPGDPMPSVRELADSLDVNMHTVRAAFAVLRAEGLVDMRRGRGITVLHGAAGRANLAELAESLVKEGRRLGFSDLDIVTAVEARL